MEDDVEERHAAVTRLEHARPEELQQHSQSAEEAHASGAGYAVCPMCHGTSRRHLCMHAHVLQPHLYSQSVIAGKGLAQTCNFSAQHQRPLCAMPSTALVAPHALHKRQPMYKATLPACLPMCFLSPPTMLSSPTAHADYSHCPC